MSSLHEHYYKFAKVTDDVVNDTYQMSLEYITEYIDLTLPTTPSNGAITIQLIITRYIKFVLFLANVILT